MLRCRDITEKASDLLEGDLTLRGWLSVRFHLAICRMCRTYVDQLRKTRALLARRGDRFRPLDREAESALIERMIGGGAGGKDGGGV